MSSLVALRGRRDVGSRLGLVLGALSVLVVAAVLLEPGWFALYPPAANDVLHTFQPPGSAHPLGTDELGRDEYSRLVYGARNSVTIGLVATLIGVVLGSLLGLAAAAGGRWADLVLMRLIDVWLAFPEILLALLVIALIGSGAANVAVAIGIAATPYYGRLVRGQALAVTRAEYVSAAKVLGVHPVRSAVRHVLPNVGGPVVVLASLGTGAAITASAGLSLLGLGPLPPTPEWGSMVAEGQSYLDQAWWIAVTPGAAIVAVVGALTVLGRALYGRTSR